MNRYLFSNIPNDETGRAFIAQCREYLNTERYKLVKKFNGPRAAAALADGYPARAYDQSLPERHATSIRVYANDSDAAQKERRASERAAWEARRSDSVETLGLKGKIEQLQSHIEEMNAGRKYEREAFAEREAALVAMLDDTREQLERAERVSQAQRVVNHSAPAVTTARCTCGCTFTFKSGS